MYLFNFMFLKQLTNNIDYNTKLENKLLSQTIYNKLFVRSNLLSNKDLKVIDNNTNFYLIKTVKNTLTFLNGKSFTFLLLGKFVFTTFVCDFDEVFTGSESITNPSPLHRVI